MLITKILKPEQFTAVEMADILYGPAADYAARMKQVDELERLLDSLVARGVIE